MRAGADRRSVLEPRLSQSWQPPPGWQRIVTVDAHAGGEPLRVIVAGFPEPRGDTALDRRRDAQQRLDGLRRTLMWEPRGHADMYGCLLTSPADPRSDFGVLFLHNEGFSTMCGHGIIGVVTVAVETGMCRSREPLTTLRIDTPAGPVETRARVAGGRVESVAFRNVPSFAVALGETVRVPDLGEVRYDLAFGGAFYAYVEVERLGLRGAPEEAGTLARAGSAIKRAVSAARSIEHPIEAELGFLYGTIFVAPPAPPAPDVHSRHVCVFADGEVDRSPTGTGVSGRLAVLAARGELGPGESVTIESILGTRFTGTIVEQIADPAYGTHGAVIPEVEGRAWITGRHEFWIDPEDPLRGGFLLGR